MAYFDVLVRQIIKVEPHPNADRLELATIEGYRAVVAKGVYQSGERVIYLPVDALLPEPLIEQLGLKGRLAGPLMNRVHSVKLRGILSQGVVMPADEHHELGQSVMEELGVKKFEPEIPEELLGEVYPLQLHEAFRFDINNIKDFPHVLEAGEEVVITEKVHGVFMVVGAVPEFSQDSNPEFYKGRAFVSSKGLFGSRLAFKTDTETPNVYVQAALEQGLLDKVIELSNATGKISYLMGEVFGSGVQDLAYGMAKGEKRFLLFNVAIGHKCFVGDSEIETVTQEYQVERVPVLYRGPFSESVLESFTNGKETVSGQEGHIREGVVVTPAVEREDWKLGRVVLKSVSEAYLLRKGGTEYS